MIKINLAPPRERRRLAISLPAFNLGILFGLLYLAAVVAIGGYGWILSGQRERLEHEVGVAQKQLDTLRATIAEGNRYKAERDELQKRLAAIEDITKRRPRPIYLLEAVADTIPRDLWITSASEREGALRFNGTAFSSTALADFMANLRRSGKFKDVDLVVARQDLDRVPRAVTFEVVCRFET
jgi:type IV pilus assembly protein PilN